jgi:hypothetical protein
MERESARARERERENRKSGREICEFDFEGSRSERAIYRREQDRCLSAPLGKLDSGFWRRYGKGQGVCHNDV